MSRNINQSSFPSLRGRRLRNSSWIRSLTSEKELNINDLIQPLFVKENDDTEEFINKMPGIRRHSVPDLAKEIEEIIKLGIKAIALFPKIDEKLKTTNGDEAINPKNLVCRTIKFLRSEFPDLGVICDVALDPYTISGHDGILNKNGSVDNDKSLEILSKMSLNLVNSGCEILAPSDMMDGRIKIIRQELEENKFSNICLIAYSAKFCSNFYGPFRNALGNEKNLGVSSKNTYQLNFKNRLEAIKEAELDTNEGADILMVKPAGYYLDIIREIKNISYLPIAAFQVSGEYAMIKFSVEQQLFNYEETVLESLNCIKRSGADMIFSYFSKEVAEWIS